MGNHRIRASPALPLDPLGLCHFDDPLLSPLLFLFSWARLRTNASWRSCLSWSRPPTGHSPHPLLVGSKLPDTGQNCPGGLMQCAHCASIYGFGGHLSLSLSVFWAGPAVSTSLSGGVGTSPPSFLRLDRPLAPSDCAIGLLRRSSVAPSSNTLPPRGVCAGRVPQQRSRGESPALLSPSPPLHSTLACACFQTSEYFDCVTLQ